MDVLRWLEGFPWYGSSRRGCECQIPIPPFRSLQLSSTRLVRAREYASQNPDTQCDCCDNTRYISQVSSQATLVMDLTVIEPGLLAALIARNTRHGRRPRLLARSTNRGYELPLNMPSPLPRAPPVSVNRLSSHTRLRARHQHQKAARASFPTIRARPTCSTASLRPHCLIHSAVTCTVSVGNNNRAFRGRLATQKG